MISARTSLKVFVLYLAVGGIALTASVRTQALPDYLKIFASDPLARPEWKITCATCHESAKGGGVRNAFGKAFQAAGYKITPELRQQFPDRFLQAPEPPKVAFSDGQSQVVIEMNGRKWRIDPATKTVTDEGPVETAPPPAVAEVKTPVTPDGIHRPGDDKIISLPTGRAVPKNGLIVNFSHRFSLNEDRTFGGFFGLDGFSNSSFGFLYGITNRIHVGFNRSPSFIGRPIEFFGGFQISDEMKGDPITSQVRVGVEASNNFTRNYVTSISGTVARSLTRHAQIAVTPTISFNNRPLLAITPVPELPGKTTFALGAGLTVKFRPSLNFIIEANQRLEGKLGTPRPSFGFGIQKVTGDGRHAFALTFNNSPGFTTAQRSGTRATLFGEGTMLDDTFSGLSIGFNITRRMF